MKKKISILLIVFIYNMSLAFSSTNDHNINSNEIYDESMHLIEEWENTASHKKYNIRTIGEWKELFEKQYQETNSSKQKTIHNKLGLILATIYHNLTYFDKGLPILEKLYLDKDKLDEAAYKSLLIKLEEIYRSKNEIFKAIKIRKERIEKKFISTYWEIYRDCGLLEAAKKDFLSFEPIPQIHSEKRLFYYAFLSGLLIEMNEIDSARNVLKTGLKEVNISLVIHKNDSRQLLEDLIYWKGNMYGQLAQCDIIENKFEGTIQKLKYTLNTTGFNIDNQIQSLILLAEAYIHFKDFSSAKQSLYNAYILMKGKRLKNIEGHFLRVKANYFKSTNQFDSAYAYLKYYIQNRETLQLNIQKNQSVLLLAELEINNRRNELINSKNNLALIENLNKKQSKQLIWLAVSLAFSILFGFALFVNIRIKNNNRRLILSQNKKLTMNAQHLEEQYKHNEILLKELHHRVKNNLQVIYSLLNIQKRRNSDPELKETISSLQTRIQTMALVHQNLYQSEKLEKVDVTYYVKNLVSHLQNLYKIDEHKVQIEFDIQTSLELNIEKIIPLGLMVNEAVSNAFKYAFSNSEKGLLQINIEQNENKLFVVIIDDGPGFNNKEIKENSIGLQLIEIMSKQLNAKYTIEHISGVTHKIEFNL